MWERINGIDMFYQDKGQGDTVVLLHGLGENSDSWHFQLEELAESYRVIAPDFRGHGRSGFDGQAITMQLFAQDVLTLLTQLQIPKVHVIGHSMGGLVAQELAVQQPERLQTMILSDSAGYYPPPLGTEGLATRLHNIDTLSMGEMVSGIVRAAVSPDASPSLQAELLVMFRQNKKEPYRQATIATLQSDYRSYHRQMTLPVLLLVGEKDQVTPPAFSQFLQTSLPQAQLIVLPGAGHMSKLENPAEYNKQVLIFLKNACQRNEKQYHLAGGI